MSLFYHKLQGIVIRGWRHALCTREVLAPRFETRWIESVCNRPDLHYYRIHSISLMHVKQPDEFILLLFYRQTFFAGPVYVFNRRNPYGPKFVLWRSFGKNIG